ncbi:MAG: glycosyltransferase family 4 protein [Desulfosalsimonadaceae bacterium]
MDILTEQIKEVPADVIPEGRNNDADKSLRVLFASGGFFAFAGSSRRYRQYFRRMPFYGIQPVVATSPPLRHKSLDGLASPPPMKGLLMRTWVDDTPAVSIRPFSEGKIVRRFMLFLLVYGILLTDRDIRVVHMLQQAKLITFLWALILRIFPVVRVLSITKDYEVKNWAYKKWLQRRQYDFYDAIICQSEDQRDYLLQLGVRTEIQIVPNGVDTELFRPASTAEDKLRLRQCLGLPMDEPVFLYVGSVQPRKGTDILLEAWQKLVNAGSKARLCIIGPRFDLKNPKWEDFTASISQAIAGPGMKDSVIFYGFKSNIVDYLQAADAFVFPSENEGIPNAVLEAMACELPCVLTPFFNNSTQLGKPEQHFMLVERTPAALAETLLKVAERPEEARRTFGRQARALMIDAMSMNHAIKAHCDLYRKHYARRFGRDYSFD